VRNWPARTPLGSKVLLKGTHKHAGETGTVTSFEKVPAFRNEIFPRVVLHNCSHGSEHCFITAISHYQVLTDTELPDTEHAQAPARGCLVRVPAPTGGCYEYFVEAGSSMQAARLAIAEHEAHHPALLDGAVIEVIPEGASARLHNADGINGAKPRIRHRAGAVRQAEPTTDPQPTTPRPHLP
jgi:hypothetical protein